MKWKLLWYIGVTGHKKHTQGCRTPNDHEKENGNYYLGLGAIPVENQMENEIEASVL